MSDVEKLEREAEFVAELSIDGASMAIVDAGFLEDEEFREEIDYGEHGIILGRGLQEHLWGDGEARARVARVDNLAALVLVDFL